MGFIRVLKTDLANIRNRTLLLLLLFLHCSFFLQSTFLHNTIFPLLLHHAWNTCPSHCYPFCPTHHSTHSTPLPRISTHSSFTVLHPTVPSPYFIAPPTALPNTPPIVSFTLQLPLYNVVLAKISERSRALARQACCAEGGVSKEHICHCTIMTIPYQA